MDIGGIEFMNKKGALLIGVNSSGKSTILKTIANSSPNKGPNKGKITVDKTQKDLIYIESESFLKSSFEGAKSFWVDRNKEILKEINSFSANNEFENELNSYIEKANEKALSKNITNINDSGISIKYEVKAIQNIFDLLGIIIFNEERYDVKDASSGVKSLVGLALANIEGNLNDKVILIDEPEAFLHPEWISLVSKLINKLLENNIVIISTHSPLLTSNIIKKHPDILSKVHKEKIPPGKVFTWKYENIKNEVKNIINCKPTFFGKEKEEYDSDFADRFMKSILNESSSMLFFWNNPLIVEGQTEKIYIEQKYHHNVISAGGFHDFLILEKICSSFSINAKFLMDKDEGNSKCYNDHVFETLNKSKSVLRLTSNFDKYLGGNPNKYQKLLNAVKKIDEEIDDPNNEKVILENFLNNS